MKSIGAKNRDKNKGEKVCVWGGGEGKVKKTNSQAEKGGKAIKIKHKKRKRVNKKEKTNIKRQ
jgi:preprotein translocase subunit YajC